MIGSSLTMVTTAIVVGVAAVLSIVLVVKNYLKYRGASVVNCPQTQKPAGVRVNAARAALTSLPGGSGKIELQECSRWPERQHCGQECLNQIRHDADSCHTSALAEQWFEGRTCTLCGKEIGALKWHDHPPALLGPEHLTMQWNEVPPEHLRRAFETRQPICWSCHMAETFRARFPERAVDRPWKRGAMGEYISEESGGEPETRASV